MANLPDEKTYVEIPFIGQLKRMDWGLKNRKLLEDNG